jgi:osmotically-inducible protein OsmY
MLLYRKLIKEAFADEPTLRLSEIKAETLKGVDQLRGAVDTIEQAQKLG